LSAAAAAGCPSKLSNAGNKRPNATASVIHLGSLQRAAQGCRRIDFRPHRRDGIAEHGTDDRP